MNQGHYETSNLDTLRGMGVMIVFFFHLVEAVRVSGGDTSMWQVRGFQMDPFGMGALLLFFVHTSFVLMQSQERSRLAGERVTSAFFIRRTFRIYPLSIACVLAVTALHIPRSLYSGPFHFLGWRAIIANLLLVQNVTRGTSVTIPLWTLPYEVQMYSLLPLVYLTVKANRTIKGAMIWFIGSVIVTLSISLVSLRAAYILQFLPSFMAGIVAYKITADGRKARWPAWCWPFFILAMILAYGFAVNSQHVSVWSFTRRGLLAASVTSLILGCLLPGFKHATNRWYVPVIRTIAKYSYGIYLTHLSLMRLFLVDFQSRFSLPVRLAFFLILAVTLPVACYHWIERPAMEFGRKLAKRGRQPVGVQATAAAV